MSHRPTIEAWETTFSDGLVATSRDTDVAPWVGGVAYVVDAAAQPEPIRTEAGPSHQIFLFDTETRASERVAHASPHFDRRLTPGDLLVYSPEFASSPHLTTWHDRARFHTVMIEPGAVARAAESLGVHYDAAEFVTRFPARDPLLEHLVRALAAEAEAGGPGGRPYAEQLIQTAAAHLVRHHTAAPPRRPAPRGGLTRVARRRAEALAR